MNTQSVSSTVAPAVNVDSRGCRMKKKKSYKNHCLALSKRCNDLQQDNERLAHRIKQVLKLLRRTRVERKFIMDRLDTHSDNWRRVELQIDLGADSSSMEGDDLKNRRTPNRKMNSKNKYDEEKDPNLPKRPANPFFRFCQEQRSIVLDQITMSGERAPTKQELTKRLANTWNIMPDNDKKIYYDVFEKSKEKYAADMEEYKLNKLINAEQQTSNYLSSL